MSSTLFDTINTPERREEAKRQQDVLREQHGSRLPQHPAQYKYGFGLARETQTADQLTALERDGAASYGEAALRARRFELYRQLGEAFASQGRFQEAVTAATEGRDEAARAVYAQYADALEKLDQGRECECPESVTDPTPHSAMGVTRQTRTPIEEVFDGTRLIVFYRCSECRTVSAELKS